MKLKNVKLRVPEGKLKEAHEFMWGLGYEYSFASSRSFLEADYLHGEDTGRMFRSLNGKSFEGVDKEEIFLPSDEPAKERIDAMTAPAILKQAAQHMEDRAATYDQPGGERSMGKAVTAFNAIAGRDLSEAEGWLLLQNLKDVRLFTNPSKPHRDSIEDCVAYAALKGESFLFVGAA